MPIDVVCPSCAHSMSVKDEFEGRKIRCPRCSAVTVAERVAEVIGDDNEEPEVLQEAVPELQPLPVPPPRSKPAEKLELDIDLFADDAPASPKPAVPASQGFAVGKPKSKKEPDPPGVFLEEAVPRPSADLLAPTDLRPGKRRRVDLDDDPRIAKRNTTSDDEGNKLTEGGFSHRAGRKAPKPTTLPGMDKSELDKGAIAVGLMMVLGVVLIILVG